MKNEKTKYAFISKNENFILYLGIIFIAFSFFLLIREIALVTHDDIKGYLNIRNMSISSYLKMSFVGSKNIGRIFQPASFFLSYIVYKPNNIILYKIIFYIYICFSVIPLWYLIYTHIDKKISILAVLFFFTFAQIDHQHNLFISYPGMQIFIGLAILSIERLLAYYKERRINTLVWSSIFLFVSTIMYEIFILYSIILFIISMYYTLKNIKNIKSVIYSLYDLRFHIILMVLFLSIYIFGRLTASGSYEGSIVKVENIKNSLKVLLTLSLGLFPLNSFLHLSKYNNILSYVKYLDLLSISKAIITSFIFITVVCKAKIISFKNFRLICIISVIGMILPNILLAITPKYNNWVNNSTYSYVSSFYSYFAIIVFLSIVSVFIYQKIDFKKTILGILSIVIFLVSVCTDINNKINAVGFSMELNKYKNFDKAVSSEYFKNIENGSVIFVPEFTGIHNVINSLNDVTFIYSPDKTFKFTNEINDLKYNRPTYLLKYSNSSNTIHIAPIYNNNMLSDEMMVISLFPLEKKNLILEMEKKGIVSIDGFSKIYDNNIIPLNNIHNDSLLIRGEKIDVLRSGIFQLNLISNSKKYSVQNSFDGALLSGWSGIEQWGVWSNGNIALLGFTMKEKENMVINLNFHLYPNPTIFSISINGKKINSYNISGSQELSIHLDNNLLVETNGVFPVVVQFNIENPAKPEGDPRMLGIGLFSFYLSPEISNNAVISDYNHIFQASNSFDGTLISGWSGIEQWGCWTEGRTAQLEFKLLEKKEILLNLNFRVFPSPTYFSIDINGVKINEYTVEGVNEIEIPIKTNYLKEENGVFPVVVQFNIENPAKPEGDPRMLGIGLFSFYLSPVE